MIESDLRNAILGDAAVSAIVGNRMFLKAPIEPQTSAYLTYFRQGKSRDMVSESNRFQVTAFSKDTFELEKLAQAVIDALESKISLNGNHYYSNSLVGQSDSREKLNDGFFWSILTFEFKHTI